MADVMKLLSALSGQESSGDPQAYNSLGLAMGKYQFQQGTWDGAAKMASREDLVGVDPREVAEVDQDHVAGTYANYLLEKSGGDLGYVAAAWYAGETNADEYSRQGRFPTAREEGDHPSVAEYVQQVKQRYNDGSYALDGVFNRSTDPFGAKAPSVPTIEPQPQSFLGETKDKFLDSLYDSTLVGAARTAWVGASSVNSYADRSFQVSQEDVDYVTKALPGDFIAQKFVLMNARNREHLSRLTLMKQEDEARRQRVDSYSMGLSSIGTIAGAIADPLTFLPLGQEAVILKTLGRLGTSTASKMALSKLAKYGELAATNAALNVAERKGAEHFSGYEQDYTSAALIGGVAGAGLGMLGDLARSFANKKGLQKVNAALLNAEDHAILQAADGPLPSGVPKDTRGILQELHDPNFTHTSENLSKLIEKDMVYVVSKADLPNLAKRLGVNIEEGAKAFHKADEGFTVIVKDNLPTNYNLDNLLAHEMGVHRFKEVMGEDAYSQLMESVRKNVENPPDEEWLRAIKAVPDGGLEEVLGYYVEHSGLDNSLLGSVRGKINLGLRKLGLTKDLNNAEIKDFVKRSLDVQIEQAQGYHMMPDGSVVMNGLKYSNANLFNPEGILADQFAADTKAITQGAFPKLLRGIGQRMEAGGFAGTIHGILYNSKSHMGRKIASLIFHDARMRGTADSLVMPVEKMKETINNRLSKFYGDFMDIRSEALFGSSAGDRLVNAPKVTNLTAHLLDFNRQVREAFNATYTNNHAGLTGRSWSPEVMKAAKVLKDLREDMIEIGKRSSEMFGTQGENLIAKDWKAWDDELWRVMDDDKWLTFHNKFPTVKAAEDFLAEYAKRAVKRDIMEQKLLIQKVKEWEESQKLWEPKYVSWKKEMDAWETKVEQLAARDEKKYQTRLKKHEEALEEWKLDIATAPKGTPKPPKPKKPERPPATPKPEKPKAPKEPGDKPTQVTPEELQQHIDEEAKGWSKGIIDRDHSNLELLKEGYHNEGAISFMRERLPMDTSTRLMTPWGEEFSFDIHLRDDDLDRIVPKIINRFSGEAALKNVFATPDAFRTARGTLESQLLHAEGQGAISKSQMARELGAFDDGIAMLRGTNSSKDPRGAWDAFTRLFTNLSYSQNGSNMGFNQLGEVGGPLAYSGGRALFHLFPALADHVRSLRSGKGIADAVREAEYRAFGDTLESRIWQRSFQSRVFKEVTAAGDRMRSLDTINTGFNFASRLVSQINLLPVLTDRMVRGARADAIADSLEWAGGKEFSKLRNPFSPTKLKGAGVSPELVPQIKQDLQRYFLDSLESPKLSEWAEANSETYWKWISLIDNQGMRAIQQNTIGNKNVLKDANLFTRMLFQFKDFTLKAINGQTLRALTSREIDDGLAALFSMGTNTLVYAGLTKGRAMAYFPNDEAKQQEYLDARLTPGKLAGAALLRGVITGSALSFGMDAYEAATGSQSFRTTVDRTAQFKGKQQEGLKEPKDALGDSLAQLPAARASFGSAYTGYKVGKSYLETNQLTQRDLKELYRLLPLQNFLPMVYISSMLVEETGLPKDKLKK
jgi:hypothetical protein